MLLVHDTIARTCLASVQIGSETIIIGDYHKGHMAMGLPVDKLATNTSLEKSTTAVAGKNAVMFATG